MKPVEVNSGLLLAPADQLPIVLVMTLISSKDTSRTEIRDLSYAKITLTSAMTLFLTALSEIEGRT